MKIAEAARLSGVSAHTIRCYEKSGILPAIQRRSDGHRQFSPENLYWLNLFAFKLTRYDEILGGFS